MLRPFEASDGQDEVSRPTGRAYRCWDRWRTVIFTSDLTLTMTSYRCQIKSEHLLSAIGKIGQLNINKGSSAVMIPYVFNFVPL